MNERRALYRQLQHYFEMDLMGLYRWGDVKHHDPEPVVIERDDRGRRINQRSLGRFIEKAVIEFDGYVLIVFSPNEIERGPGEAPSPAVQLYDGIATAENLVVQGANRRETWAQVTRLLRENLEKGKQNERAERSAGW